MNKQELKEGLARQDVLASKSRDNQNRKSAADAIELRIIEKTIPATGDGYYDQLDKEISRGAA